jgi:hypothetical protein
LIQKRSVSSTGTCFGKISILETVYDGVLGSPKSHRRARPVYIDADLVRDLRAYKRLYPNASDDGFVFPSESRNTPMDYANVLHRWIHPTRSKLILPRNT